MFALHNAHARALKGMKRFQVGYTVSVVGFGFVCWFRWIVIFHFTHALMNVIRDTPKMKRNVQRLQLVVMFMFGGIRLSVFAIPGIKSRNFTWNFMIIIINFDLIVVSKSFVVFLSMKNRQKSIIYRQIVSLKSQHCLLASSIPQKLPFLDSQPTACDVHLHSKQKANARSACAPRCRSVDDVTDVDRHIKCVC